MRILNTSIYDEFLNLVGSAKSNIKLCSPFIKSDMVNRIYENINTSCSISLITNVSVKYRTPVPQELLEVIFS